jgi:hypothetical protein
MQRPPKADRSFDQSHQTCRHLMAHWLVTPLLWDATVCVTPNSSLFLEEQLGWLPLSWGRFFKNPPGGSNGMSQSERAKDRSAGIPALFVSSLCLCISACGSNSNTKAPPPVNTSYSISAIVSGLAGRGLVVSLNQSISVPVSSDGTVILNSGAKEGTTYAVGVGTQPASPWQTCSVKNATGTVPAANVTNIAITCTTNTYPVSATITGLVGSSVGLTLNGASPLSVASNGSSSFASQLASGTTYSVVVAQNPTLQGCSVSNGSGTITNGPVSNVGILCSLALPSAKTSTSLGSDVPAGVAKNITSVISGVDAQPLGDALEFPSGGFFTPIFAVDSNQDPLLVAPASSGTTTLSVDSTASYFALMALGPVPKQVTIASVVTLLKAAPAYPKLIGDVTSALASDTSPVLSEAVATDANLVASQSASSGSASVITPTSLKRDKARPLDAPPQPVAPPLPVPLIGPFSNSTLGLYISAQLPTGVTVSDAMAIAWSMSSSADSTQIPIGGVSPLLQLVFPSAIEQVNVKGVDPTFVLTASQTDGMDGTKGKNLLAVSSDLISSSLTLLTGAYFDDSSDCVKLGVNTVLLPVDSVQALILTQPTGVAAQSIYVQNVTSNLSNALKASIACVLPQAGTIGVIQNWAR